VTLSILIAIEMEDIPNMRRRRLEARKNALDDLTPDRPVAVEDMKERPKKTKSARPSASREV